MPKFECIICDYVTIDSSNYKKHLLTGKHLLKETSLKNEKKCGECGACLEKNTKILPLDTCIPIIQPANQPLAKKQLERECPHCMNVFSSRQSLWVHLKTCRSKKLDLVVANVEHSLVRPDAMTDPIVTKEYIRNEINNILISNRTILTGVLNNITTQNITTTNIMNNTTTNNNVFNLNMFLNEQCKDAMNFSEFINNIEFTEEDLENCGRNGYVSGITEIFQRNLEKCGIYKRPIHCTDVKREVLHIKENDIWQKEEIGNPITKKYVVIVGNKGVKKISSWSDKHAKSKIMDTPEYNLWLCIGKNVNNGGQDEVKNYNKVLKNLTLMTDISDIKKSLCNK